MSTSAPRDQPPAPRPTADRLHSASIHLLRALKPNDRAQGISQAQLSALSVLRFAGRMSISALAAAEGVKVPTMSRLVKDMTATKLVAREAHPTDARACIVRLTTRGARLFEKARGARLDAIVRVLNGMGERELRTVATAAGLMERIAKELRSADEHGAASDRGRE